MGSGVDEATATILEGTGIQAESVQQWGAAIASGGEAGKTALMDVSLALSQIDDDVKRNDVGVAFFGTLWEEQGLKITDTILNASDHVGDLAEGQQLVNDTIEELDNTPQVQLAQALKDMGEALEPILVSIASLISHIAKWMSDNPQLSATIVAIVSALAMFAGIVALVMPVILGLMGTAAALTTTVAALASPFLIVIGIIAAVIAIGVALWLNFDKIAAGAKNLSKKVSEGFRELSKAVAEKMGEVWENVKTLWGKVTTFFSEIDLKEVGKNIIQGLINGILSMGENVKKAAKNIANGIGNTVKEILKLGSPSKLLEAMGADTGAGMVIGLKKSIGNIKSISSDLAQAAIPDMQQEINLTGSGATNAAGKQLTVNMYSPKALDIREANKQFNRTLNRMALLW